MTTRKRKRKVRTEDNEVYIEKQDAHETYMGNRDEYGQYHGRGTLIISENDLGIVRFEGHFEHGIKHGRGCMYFSEWEYLQGNWNQGELSGPATYMAEDGSATVGSYVDGELCGTVQEFYSDGKLAFEGEYQNNLRHGHGKASLQDGGAICGIWQEGRLHGKGIQYRYQPGFACFLEGEWHEGEMQQARYIDAQGCYSKEVFCYDPSTESCISLHPLLPDLFEQSLVSVKNSPIPSAAEGLFAKVDIPSNIVCSFYNGIRVLQSVVDKRPWAYNANTITLESEESAGVVIDVPPEQNSTSVYCASLGHKANHSFIPNAKYDCFEHPRFGSIKCIRTIRPVKAGEEITVEYGYDKQKEHAASNKTNQIVGPPWFRAIWKEYIQKSSV